VYWQYIGPSFIIRFFWKCFASIIHLKFSRQGQWRGQFSLARSWFFKHDYILCIQCSIYFGMPQWHALSYHRDSKKIIILYCSTWEMIMWVLFEGCKSVTPICQSTCEVCCICVVKLVPYMYHDIRKALCRFLVA
jgi:hypothetical protein